MTLMDYLILNGYKFEVIDSKARNEMPVGLDVDAFNNLYMFRNDGELIGRKIQLPEGINGLTVLEDDNGGKMLYLTKNGEITGEGVEFNAGSGGGGGSLSGSIVKVINESGTTSIFGSYGQDLYIKYRFSSIDAQDGSETGNGTAVYYVNGAKKYSHSIKQGSNSFNIGKYLEQGNNVVKVTVTDNYGTPRTLSWTVVAENLTVTSTFDYKVAYNGVIPFTYVPNGSLEKTVYFVLDGKEIGTATVASSGRQQTFNIPKQSHGVHSFEVYFTVTMDGQTVSSNKLYYELVCIEEGEEDPIIACNFTGKTTEQYASLAIPYRVYTPNSLTSPIELLVNGEQFTTLTVDRTEQTWAYRVTDTGALTLTIKCGEKEKSLYLTATESEIKVEAVKEDLVLHLSSYGRNNNEENPEVWSYEDIHASLTNFNWKSDGWQLDKDNNTVLRVAGDARVNIPLNIFANDFRTTGKTIEIEFATRDVLNYDAILISCMSDNRGIEIGSQKAIFKSEQSTIETQYKEDEHVRLTFVIEKTAEHRLLYCYINGEMSRILQYPKDDDFSQMSPVGISIGSNECTTDIYCIRVYDNDLTRFQVLDNFIADSQNVEEMIARYLINDVFDAYGSIVIPQLPEDLPYLVLEGSALPQSKGDKKTISGYYVDPKNPSKSFKFEGAIIDVQGTSSQYYRRKNYKIKYKGGFVLDDGTVLEVYAMNNKAVPVDTFTYKADVASSEGANNVELARLYNDACPYKTPPQEEDERVRQGIDGFPIVVFWNNGNTTTFLGKYNFNNDKGTPEVFGFSDADESWEIKNNTSDRVLWKSDNFATSDWQNDFEARHPEDNTNTTLLNRLSTWILSTDQTKATDSVLGSPVTYGEVTYTNDTAEYRLAKFKYEVENYIVKDSLLFFYLFTELFLMVDNRAKNAFPTYFNEEGKWCFLPYDFDTAIGTNNEGALVFSYELEDIDKTPSGADVYNGQDSVLWVNTRQAFPEELMTMFQTLRADEKLSFEDTEKRFKDHQSKWPQAIFNEDSYFKYIQPLIEENNGSYLNMLQGSKSEQRKWWLYNRFRYIDSKYNAGDAVKDYITIRGYAKADIVITPYADIYATVKYGSYLVQKRALRGSSYTLECPLDNVNDTEIYPYSASQIKDIGDLSGFLMGYGDFSMATKLQRLKIGDASSTYVNNNLTELYLGNNTLLKHLDVRNCPNLTMAVDISGCSNIEEVYFDGTSITGLSLPNGGMIKTLHLPETLTNLTILNQKAITDFTIGGYSNVTTLRLENVSSVIDAREILETIQANSRVRLLGVNWSVESEEELETLVARLDSMRGLDEEGKNLDMAQISGTVSIDTVSGALVADIKSKYPDLKVNFNHINCVLYFYSEDGETLLGTTSVTDGADGAYNGTTPTKESTAQYNYTFAGWSTRIGGNVNPDALKKVSMDRNLYAYFTSTIRTYTVKFYNGNTLLQTNNNVPYGSSVAYKGSTPIINTGVTIEDWGFIGWSPEPTNIQGDINCYAQYEYLGYVTRQYLGSTTKITELSSESITTVGYKAFLNFSYLETVSFPEATEIGDYAFDGCIRLANISIPKVTKIGMNAFENCAFEYLYLPEATELNSSIFAYGGIKKLDLTKHCDFTSNVFFNNSTLETLILRSEELCSLKNTFKSNSPMALGTGYIYVPKALIEDYKVATNWSTYASQFRAIEDYPDICSIGGVV